MKRHRIAPYFFLCISVLFVGVSRPAFSQEDKAVQLYLQALPLYEEGTRSYDKNTLEESAVFLHAAYQENPFYYDVVRDLSRVYFLLGENRKARRYTEELLQLRFQNIEGLIMKANLDIRDGNFESANAIILEVETNYQYNRGLLLTKIFYHSMLGNYRQVDNSVFLFQKVYPESDRTTQILLVINAISRKQNTAEVVEITNEMYHNKLYDIYVLWLLSEYYFAFENKERLNTLLPLLIESGYEHLEKLSLQKLFSLNIRTNYEAALEIARKYAERYPLDGAAWFNLGYCHYYYKYYFDASEAFKRGYEITPSDEFPLFMYDVSLKKGGPRMSKIRDLRIEELNQKIKDSISRSDFITAEELSRRALFVNPLASMPRYLLGIIYQERGQFEKANEQFEILKTRNVDLDRNVEYFFDNNKRYIEETQKPFKNVVKEKLDVYPWLFSVIGQSQEQYVGKGTFLRELFIFYLSKYKKFGFTGVPGTGDTRPFIQEDDYEIQLNYLDEETQFRVSASIYAKQTRNFLYFFSATGYGEERVLSATKILARKINNSMPTISSFAALQDNGFLLAGGKDAGLAKDELLPIHNRAAIFLQREMPYVRIASPRLGFAQLTDVFNTHSVGTVKRGENPENLQTDRYGLGGNLDIGDLVIVAPKKVELDERQGGEIQSISSSVGKFSQLFSSLRFIIW